MGKLKEAEWRHEIESLMDGEDEKNERLGE